MPILRKGWALSFLRPQQTCLMGRIPHRTGTDLRLSINGTFSETIRVTLCDLVGLAVKYFSFASKPSITMGQDLKAAVYMIEVSQGKNMKILKLVKFYWIMY